MQRWHLTLGLAAAALIATFAAPRLIGSTPATPGALPMPIATPDGPAVTPMAVAPPSADGSLVLRASLDQGALLRGAPSERFLVIDLAGPEHLRSDSRDPVDLAVVVDTSGSMSAEGKIGYAREGARYLLSELSPTDSFALVTFSDFAATAVPLTPAAERDRIGRVIDRLMEGGGTNLGDGLESGTRELQRAKSGDLRRLVLLSDGQANVGVTDPDALARRAAELASQGISVSTIGLGLDYNEDLLTRIADLGGGSYDFVDTPQELHAALADELDRTKAQVARGTAVSIDLPPGVEPLEVIGWDAVRTSTGWKVFVGDVYAGAKRKIVVRVRVTGDGTSAKIADVRADWDDLVLDRAASTQATAVAAVSDDPQVVQGSTNKDAAIAANQAYGNWFVEQSNQAYKAGRRDAAQGLLDQAVQVLDVASRSYDAPALAADVDRVSAQRRTIDVYDAGSAEGKMAVKQSQEIYRDAAK